MLESKAIEYPSPQRLYDEMMGNSWDYKRDRESYLTRDRAFLSILYLLACRTSEALRLTKGHFTIEESNVIIKPFLLSKSKRLGVPRKNQSREGYLPLTGERNMFTDLVLKYLDTIKDEDTLLFTFTRHRAWEIALSTIPTYCDHWLRAFGEDYLYDTSGFDLVAVADYVKVDPLTLSKYLRSRWKRIAKMESRQPPQESSESEKHGVL